MLDFKIKIADNSNIFNVIEDIDTKNIRINDEDKYKSIVSSATGIPINYIENSRMDEFNGWHKVDDIWYRFKYVSDFSAINEILGEYISGCFNLPTAKYYLAKNGDISGVVTPNFCSNDKSYITLKELGYKSTSNFDLLDDLELDYEDVIDTLKRVIVRDFYASESDRYNRNLMFEYCGDELYLAPLYDYELSFVNKHNYLFVGLLATFDIRDINTQDILRNDEAFMDAINVIMDINMNRLLEKLEDEFKVLLDRDTKKFYTNHDTKIKNYIRKYNLIGD
nr:hypothetical protein [Bacilli bacterium]